MKKGDENQISFAIQGIKTEQYALFVENYKTKGNIELGTEIQIKIDHVNKQIGVFLGFDFIQSKKVFLKIQVSCHFKIEPLSWDGFKNEEQNKIIIPQYFLAHLVMITTGTSRGILHEKTEGTSFSKFIIPTLNVAEMIKNDGVFDMLPE